MLSLFESRYTLNNPTCEMFSWICWSLSCFISKHSTFLYDHSNLAFRITVVFYKFQLKFRQKYLERRFTLSSIFYVTFFKTICLVLYQCCTLPISLHLFFHLNQRYDNIISHYLPRFCPVFASKTLKALTFFLAETFLPSPSSSPSFLKTVETNTYNPSFYNRTVLTLTPLAFLLGTIPNPPKIHQHAVKRYPNCWNWYS